MFRWTLRRFRHDPAAHGRSLLVRMDIINRCNSRCFMCPYVGYLESGAPTQAMDSALFERIAARIFPYTCHLALSCAFEPLLHPRFRDLLAIAARHGVPEWGVVTNASLLDEKMAAAILDSRMPALALSLDGVTRETYRAIRGIDAFDAVLANIRRLQEMKRRAGVDHPHLFANFVLMRRNLDEVVPYLALCRELGVEDVTFVHVMPRSRENAQSLLNDPDRYAAVYREAKRIAESGPMRVLLPAPFTPDELAAAGPADRERRLQQSRADDLRTGGAQTALLPVEGAGDDIFCASPWMMVFISPNGDVHPCSHRQNDPPFGNLAVSSFQEIWNGPAYLELRRRLYRHRLEGLCRTCEAFTPNSEPMVRRPIRIL